MELRIILRGAVSGAIAGVLGFIFARIFAEPLVNKAIDYESGRDEILNKLNEAAGHAITPDGPEVFSRSIQSTIGIASGIIAFSVAMGALIAVVYIVLHGRFHVRPRILAGMIAGFGFLGVYMLPFVKYPANPPAIGHTFTIVTRGQLYLTMVVCSVVLLAAAIYLARRLMPRFGLFNATLLSGLAFLVIYGALIGLLPSLGSLQANIDHENEFGYTRAATETPQPITDADGNIVYPGFDADTLWKFRFYSVLEQLLIWGATGLVFGVALERYLAGARSPASTAAARQRVPGDTAVEAPQPFAPAEVLVAMPSDVRAL